MIQAPAGLAEYAQLVAEVRGGNEIMSLGRTWSGHDIVAVRCNIGVEPPILITAGSHGVEHAGVVAAIKLVKGLQTKHTTYVIPCRDPIGVDGFARAVSIASGRDVEIGSFADAERVLQGTGRVVWRENDLVVAIVGEVAFATMEPSTAELRGDPLHGLGYQRLLSRLSEAVSQNSRLRDALRGRRVVVPALYFQPWTGPYDRAHTVMCTSGITGMFPGFKDLNSLFGHPNTPPEVATVQRFIERVAPALILDLHVGYGADFYLFTSFLHVQDALRREVGEAMARAVSHLGVHLPTRDELQALTYWQGRFEFVSDGFLMHYFPTRREMLINYFEAYGLTFQPQAGQGAPFNLQVAMSVASVQEAVARFETTDLAKRRYA